MNREHKWSSKDNIVALYYYKFGTQYLGITEEEISFIIDTTIDSLKMQALNFKTLDTNGYEGLSDYSTVQKEVYDKYKSYLKYVINFVFVIFFQRSISKFK